MVAQPKWIWLASTRTQVRSLALLSGLRIWHCHEPWHRSQMWLGSHVAVAVVQASSSSSSSIHSLGISICHRCSPKKTKKKKKKTGKFTISINLDSGTSWNVLFLGISFTKTPSVGLGLFGTWLFKKKGCWIMFICQECFSVTTVTKVEVFKRLSDVSGAGLMESGAGFGSLWYLVQLHFIAVDSLVVSF